MSGERGLSTAVRGVPGPVSTRDPCFHPVKPEVFFAAQLRDVDDLARVHREVLDDVIHRLEHRDVATLNRTP